MLRIAIIQGAFLPVPPLLGGAVEKMWFFLGKEFARRGHAVTHISRNHEDLPDAEFVNGVHYLRVQGYKTPKSGLILKGYDLLYTLNVRKLLSADFDIVVTNTFWAPILLAAKYQRACMVDVQRMPKRQMRLYGQVSRLRANSTPVASAIRQGVNSASQDKVVLIPNPLPFVPTQRIDFAHKKPIILYAGRIHTEKGLDLLIRAFRKTTQAYRLQIVGPWDVSAGGSGAPYLEALRQLAGNADIEFIEPIYDIQALNKRYIDASLFVYPSVAEQGETFGLAPLEAMAWGCVPIVSNLACFHDFIKDGENGLIFDHRAPTAISQLAAHISLLQQNDPLRIKLAKNALNVRHTHSVTHIASLFLDEFYRISTEKKETYGNPSLSHAKQSIR